MADEFLLSFGIKVPDLIGGLAGGVVNAFVFQRTSPLAVVGSVIVGCLTSAYLTEPATKFFGTTNAPTSFLVGLCAMAICQAIVAAAAKWKPPTGGTGGT